MVSVSENGMLWDAQYKLSVQTECTGKALKVSPRREVWEPMEGLHWRSFNKWTNRIVADNMLIWPKATVVWDQAKFARLLEQL